MARRAKPTLPESEMFGKDDMDETKMVEKRKQDSAFFKEQLEFIAQRKRDALLQRCEEQRKELEILERAKQSLAEEKACEDEWRSYTRQLLKDDFIRVQMERKREDHLRGWAGRYTH